MNFHTPALNVKNVSAGYPGDKFAIHDVTFAIQRGERVAVVGPNGAGKSTLFKAIVGIIPFTKGEISIHGADCRSSHSMIGYVPQYNEIDWKFPATVYDVVMMGRAREIGWFRFPRKLDRHRVCEVLDKVGMADLSDRQIGDLSGGQKRRVFIARALAQETDVLLLDEPFNGVDVNAIEEIMDTLDFLKEQNVTVIVATHDMELAVNRFDKLLLLNQKVVAYGSADEAFKPEHLKAAYGGYVSILRDAGQTIILTDEHGHG